MVRAGLIGAGSQATHAGIAGSGRHSSLPVRRRRWRRL
ncbi:hypothetical protein GLE_2521 [Lysobacter enzymogenes]|uniref:Uncharacterized protein n=1 Tax=Lysobacter enzymogenes TaxID=69 RepID=A0A0S2DHH2_LYSEN|nr:hypothetical protein GLE_2521 [Lysobacter enzymogenes]